MLVFKGPLFYLIMAPKGKSSDAGNSDMPMRSHKVLIVSKEVKVLDYPKNVPNCTYSINRFWIFRLNYLTIVRVKMDYLPE